MLICSGCSACTSRDLCEKQYPWARRTNPAFWHRWQAGRLDHKPNVVAAALIAPPRPSIPCKCFRWAKLPQIHTSQSSLSFCAIWSCRGLDWPVLIQSQPGPVHLPAGFFGKRPIALSRCTTEPLFKIADQGKNGSVGLSQPYVWSIHCFGNVYGSAAQLHRRLPALPVATEGHAPRRDKSTNDWHT